MTPAQVVCAAHEAGLTIRVDGMDLVVRPANRLTPSMRALLVAHKPGLISLFAEAPRTTAILVMASARLRDSRHEQSTALRRRPTACRRDPTGLPSGDFT